MSRLRAVIAILIVASLAGCADAPKPQANLTPAPTVAPEPVVNETTGSITGLVLDEEALPIVGATVNILRTEHVSKTDSGGAFTLNSIAPGTHTLFVEALGFESSGRKIEIAEGQVAHANFTLKALLTNATQPRHVSMVRTAFINVDQTWFTYVYHDLANQNHSQICGSCIFTLVFDKSGVQFMTEFTYTQTHVPAYNDGVHISVESGTVWGNAQFCWRQQHVWPMEGLGGVGGPMSKEGKAEIAVQSSFAGVSFQHRMDMWNSIAYVDPLPDGYTALPPTTEKRQDPSVCIIT